MSTKMKKIKINTTQFLEYSNRSSRVTHWKLFSLFAIFHRGFLYVKIVVFEVKSWLTKLFFSKWRKIFKEKKTDHIIWNLVHMIYLTTSNFNLNWTEIALSITLWNWYSQYSQGLIRSSIFIMEDWFTILHNFNSIE